MSDIFISYAKTDRKHAEQLAAALAEEGWTVWWDPHIEPGDDFDEVIEAQLDVAMCVVVLWSECSRKSRYVKGEARFAMAQGKLVPAFIEEEIKPPFDFHSIQGVRIHDWDGDKGDTEYQKLVARIARRVEEAGLGEDAASKASPTEAEAERRAEEEQAELQPQQEEQRRAEEAERRAAETKQLPKAKEDRQQTTAPPSTVFQDRLQDGSQGPEMVTIPAGDFWMGSDKALDTDAEDNELPRHRVIIAKGFAMGKYPITFEEYDRFAGDTGRGLPSDEGWGRGNRPVINVSWEDATAYTEWLSTQTGKRYRLPTEAEWEYAARANTTTPYWWGNEINQDGKIWTNCAWCGSRWDLKSTAPVGSFDPNGFGLYDMLGNVWEWVEDCWHENYEGAPEDGSAWISGGDYGSRVLRGGSWFNGPSGMRSAFRFRIDRGYRKTFWGFRVAQDR